MLCTATLIIVVGLTLCTDESTSSLNEKYESVIEKPKNLERRIFRKNRAVSNFDKTKKWFTDDERVLILQKHNEYRRLAKAADMNALTWDPELEAVAQAYAEKCQFIHSKVSNVAGFEKVGENLYASNGMFTTKGVERWYDSEYMYYDYETATCDAGKQCGHYTQMMWASTSKVGCGLNFCDILGVVDGTNQWFYVCNYGIAGNFQFMQPYMYVEGFPCSICDVLFPSCKDNLCYDPTCGGKTCSNGGVLLPVICECNCSSTAYTGTFCDEDTATTTIAVVDTTTTESAVTTTGGNVTAIEGSVTTTESAVTTKKYNVTTDGDGSDYLKYSALCMTLPLISIDMWLFV